MDILNRRAKLYAAKFVKVLTLRSRGEGCVLGCVLTLMFWGSLLLRAGDVETNPGPLRGGGSGTGGGGAGRGGATVQTRLMAGATGSPDRAGGSGAGGGGGDNRGGAGDSQMMMEMRKMFTEFGSQQQLQQQQSTDKVLSKMNELEAQINHKFEALQKDIEALQTDVSVLQQENDELRTTCDTLWQRVETLEQRADDQEARSKRNNLLFFGLKRDEDESAQASENKVKSFLRDNLGLTEQIEFDRVHRIGNKQDAPLIARCTFYKDKIKILRNRNKLNGTNLYVKEDLPVYVRETRKKLGELVKVNRDRGERVRIVYDHVYIENKKFVLNENRNALVEIR